MNTKKLAILAVLSAIPAALAVYIFLYGNYSTGARAGDLVKFSMRGMIVKTGEGELQLGNDSGRATVQNTTSKEENPWHFSGGGADAENMIGQAVVIDYVQPYLTFSAFGDTKYRVKQITPLDTTKPENCGDSNGGGWKSGGVRSGRIVKASTKGTIFKTHEIAIQVGGSGNQFIDMSIPSDEIFNCAMNFLRAGQKARIFYGEDFFVNPLAQDTTYTVRGIIAEN